MFFLFETFHGQVAIFLLQKFNVDLILRCLFWMPNLKQNQIFFLQFRHILFNVLLYKYF